MSKVDKATTSASATPPGPPARFRVDPDGSRVRKLSAPIRGHEGPIHELRLSAPRYRDFMDLGDPSAYVVLPNGGYVPHEDYAMIDKYIERLAGPNGQFVDQLGLDDAMALKDMVLSFFRQGLASTSTHTPTT